MRPRRTERSRRRVCDDPAVRWLLPLLLLLACESAPPPAPQPTAAPTPSCAPQIPTTARPRTVQLSAAWWGTDRQTRTVATLERRGRVYDVDVEQLQAPPSRTRRWQTQVPLADVDPLRALLIQVPCGEVVSKPPAPDDTARRRIELRYADPATTVVLSSESPGDGAPWAVSDRRNATVRSGVRDDSAVGAALDALIEGLEVGAPAWPDQRVPGAQAD